jgi:hypothetical protein
MKDPGTTQSGHFPTEHHFASWLGLTHGLNPPDLARRTRAVILGIGTDLVIRHPHRSRSRERP